MLERVHLPGYGDKNIAQLSGGQKQRVAIARSLVLEPSLLLLDEPLGALDLKLREQMKIELKKLQADIGTTFMYITHDQSEALVMSDRVAVMNHGRFEQIDTPRNLYSNPASRFVAGFVGETNILPVRRHHRELRCRCKPLSDLSCTRYPGEQCHWATSSIYLSGRNQLFSTLPTPLPNINLFSLTGTQHPL